jgi:hypothetical protein
MDHLGHEDENLRRLSVVVVCVTSYTMREHIHYFTSTPTLSSTHPFLVRPPRPLAFFFFSTLETLSQLVRPLLSSLLRPATTTTTTTSFIVGAVVVVVFSFFFPYFRSALPLRGDLVVPYVPTRASAHHCAREPRPK